MNKIRSRSDHWRRAAAAMLLIATVWLSACQPGRPDLVRVVVSFPMRGPKIGPAVVNGIQLAFDEINSRIGGTRIELAILDNGDASGQWQPDLETRNAQDAAADPLTVAYLGPLNSGAAQLSIPITNRAGLVQISPSTTWPGLTKVGFAQGQPAIFYPTGQRTFYRTCATDDVQGPAAALWARELGFKTFYVLDDGEAYGAGVAALFAQQATQIGLAQTGAASIDKTAKDFGAVLDKVKAADPDVVYFGGTVANGAAILVQQMRGLGITSAFMGPDAIVDTTLIDAAGKDAEGVYATFVGAPPDQLTTTDRGLKFYEDYQRKYGVPPEAFSQSGYDAARVLIEVMQQSPTLDRASMLAGVRARPAFDGTVGAFGFDANGDTTVRLISGNVVKGGVFTFERLLTVVP